MSWSVSRFYQKCEKDVEFVKSSSVDEKWRKKGKLIDMVLEILYNVREWEGVELTFWSRPNQIQPVKSRPDVVV